MAGRRHSERQQYSRGQGYLAIERGRAAEHRLTAGIAAEVSHIHGEREPAERAEVAATSASAASREPATDTHVTDLGRCAQRERYPSTQHHGRPARERRGGARGLFSEGRADAPAHPAARAVG